MKVKECTIDELCNALEMEIVISEFLSVSLVPDHYSGHFPAETLIRTLGANSDVIIGAFAEDGTCAGLVFGKVADDLKANSLVVNVSTFLVFSKHRGGTVAGRLMKCLRHVARQRGCNGMFFSAVHGSEMSRGFAKRMKPVYDIYYGDI